MFEGLQLYCNVQPDDDNTKMKPKKRIEKYDNERKVTRVFKTKGGEQVLFLTVLMRLAETRLVWQMATVVAVAAAATNGREIFIVLS